MLVDVKIIIRPKNILKVKKSIITKATRPFESAIDSLGLMIASLAEISS